MAACCLFDTALIHPHRRATAAPCAGQSSTSSPHNRAPCPTGRRTPLILPTKPAVTTRQVQSFPPHLTAVSTLLSHLQLGLAESLYHSSFQAKTELFISPSGISELDCATTKTDTAESSISIGRESLQVFFVLGCLGVLRRFTARV